MGQNAKAAEIYTKAIESEEFVRGAALLKRAISNLDCKNYDKSMEDLKEVLETDPSNSEAYFFKGVLLIK